MISIKRIKQNIPNKSLRKIDKTDCQKCLNDLYIKNKLSKSSIRKAKITLNLAFTYANNLGYLKTNPVKNIVIPKKANKKITNSLSSNQQKKVEIACDNDKYGHVILFYLYSGLRLMELVNLEWSDYNSEEKTIIVRKSKTKNGLRILPVSNILEQIINRQIKRSKYIFTQPNGDQLTDTVLKKTCYRIRQKTGINTLTIHVCRHSFATRLVENNVDIKSVSNLLGHSDARFTADRYVHPEIKHLRNQIEQLDMLSKV